MKGIPYRSLIEAIMRSAVGRVRVDEYNLGFSSCLRG